MTKKQYKDCSVHPLEDPLDHPVKLTQSILQITQMLGMYQAELARVLHLHCSDIGLLSNAKSSLIADTQEWAEAKLFYRMYALLYQKMGGEGAQMRHWLRTHNAALGGEPLLLIIDEGKLAKIVQYLAIR